MGRIPLLSRDYVIQSFRFTTGSREFMQQEWIKTHFDSINCVLGYVIKGPSTASVAATMTGTFTGVATAADTITIAGIIYTARAAPGTEAYAFDIGTDATTQAAALVDAVNYGCVSCGQPTAFTIGPHPDVIASNVAGVVTFTARRPGLAGNSIVISENCDNYTDSGAACSGGSGPDVGQRAGCVYTFADVNVATKYTEIDGIKYYSRAVPGAEAHAVDVGANSAEAARNLSEAINADGTAANFGTGTVAHPTCYAQYNPGTSTVQVYARQFGNLGNSIIIGEDETNGSWAGGATVLTGGTGSVAVPQVEFQLNAQGVSVAEGTNTGDLGVSCSEANMTIEVTLLGVATAG
jgi:hypothetical protein